MAVYRHCQHTFQYNQLEKVHVPLYDPFKRMYFIINLTYFTFIKWFLKKYSCKFLL